MLWYLVPLFFILGCLFLAVGIGLALLIRPGDNSFLASIGITIAAGIGMPVLSVLLVLFIPTITTILRPSQRVVELEYRRPLWTSRKVYHLADIADVRPIYIGDRGYSLALILKSGRRVRIEYSSSSDVQSREKTAANIMLQLAPYLQNVQ